jgi:hypothetical protein
MAPRISGEAMKKVIVSDDGDGLDLPPFKYQKRLRQERASHEAMARKAPTSELRKRAGQAPILIARFLAQRSDCVEGLTHGLLFFSFQERPLPSSGRMGARKPMIREMTANGEAPIFNARYFQRGRRPRPRELIFKWDGMFVARRAPPIGELHPQSPGEGIPSGP